MNKTPLSAEESEGRGAPPMFDDDEVKDIVERLLPLLASASQPPPRTAGDAENAQQLFDLCDVADQLSEEVAELTAQETTSIRHIADLADVLKGHLSPDRNWSTAQRVTMVEMAIRMRRYARNEPGSLALFIQDIRDRVDTKLTDPIIHW